MRTKKDSYLVEGMTCSGCERTVSKVIGNIEGVTSAKADLGSASLTVEYDPDRVTIGHIKAAISKTGYKIVGEIPSHGQREGNDEAIS